MQFDSDALLHVLELVRQMAVPCDLLELLDQVGTAGRTAFNADRGSVLLYDENSRELYSVGGPVEVRFSIETGISGEAAREKKIVYVPDCQTDPRFNNAVDLKTGYTTRVLLAVPLIGLEDKLVGLLTMLNPAKGHFTEADQELAHILASQAAVAIQRARLLDERLVKLKLERDMDLARQIQMGVMPERLAQPEGYRLASFVRPADATGGDIFDVVPGIAGDPNRLLLLLADATGHGVGPAISVTQVRAMVRMGVRLGGDLARLTNHINNQLVTDLSSERFVTAFLGDFDPSQHLLRYHSPGQAPLLHYVANQKQVRIYEATSFPLGIMEVEDQEPAVEIRFEPGDMFILMTDGFYEYQNAEDELFGSDRVASIIEQYAEASPDRIIQAVLSEIGRFSDQPQADDLTALILKREVADGR